MFTVSVFTALFCLKLLYIMQLINMIVADMSMLSAEHV